MNEHDGDNRSGEKTFSGESEWAPLILSGGFSWTEPGASLQGTWLGSTVGEHGPRGVLETDAGEVVRFSLPVSLRQQVGELDEGVRCRITYTGERVAQRTRRSYKTFVVQVAKVRV